MNQRTYVGRAAIPTPRSSEDTLTLPTPDPLAPVALAAYRLTDPNVPDELVERFASNVEAFLRGLVGPACCTEPATVRYEVYSPRNGMAHGSLDASVNYCAEHAPGAVAALHRDGFTAYRANNRPSGGQVCGDRFDFTKGVGTAVASLPVAPTQGVGQRPVPPAAPDHLVVEAFQTGVDLANSFEPGHRMGVLVFARAEARRDPGTRVIADAMADGLHAVLVDQMRGEGVQDPDRMLARIELLIERALNEDPTIPGDDPELSASPWWAQYDQDRLPQALAKIRQLAAPPAPVVEADRVEVSR